MTLTLKELLTSYVDQKVYLFTTQGHVIAGTLEDVEEFVRLVAPDGRTQVQLNLTDVSSVRPYAEEVEVSS